MNIQYILFETQEIYHWNAELYSEIGNKDLLQEKNSWTIYLKEYKRLHFKFSVFACQVDVHTI